MTKVPISWGLMDKVVHETFTMLSRAKHIPQVICCNRPKDFIAGAWMMQNTTSSCFGSVEVLDRLVKARCKVVLLSIDNDPRLPDLITSLHARLSALPFFYSVKSVVMFNSGYPVYDIAVFELPFQPTYPWEVQTGRVDEFQEISPTSSTHIQSTLPPTNKKP